MKILGEFASMAVRYHADRSLDWTTNLFRVRSSLDRVSELYATVNEDNAVCQHCSGPPIKTKGESILSQWPSQIPNIRQSIVINIVDGLEEVAPALIR